MLIKHRNRVSLKKKQLSKAAVCYWMEMSGQTEATIQNLMRCVFSPDCLGDLDRVIFFRQKIDTATSVPPRVAAVNASSMHLCGAELLG